VDSKQEFASRAAFESRKQAARSDLGGAYQWPKL